MITGFNTDVEFGGVTYHVQTEDKGVSTPIILSLVYNRGTILAAKREPYDDLLESGLDEKVLADRLRKQHKTICAAVKKGRIEELKGLANKQKRPAFAAAPVSDLLEIDDAPRIAKPRDNSESDNDGPASADPFQDIASPIPMPADAIVFPKKRSQPNAEPIIENATILDFVQTIPVEAVSVVSDLAGTDRPTSNKLSIELIGDGLFFGGRNYTVTIMVCRGSGRKVVDSAEIMVKVLGSSFRPLIFHSQTDKNGISNVALQIPTFHTGRASILVRAIHKGEEVELRRPIING